MHECWKPIVACLALAALLVAPGCGGGDSGETPKAPEASIGGPGSQANPVAESPEATTTGAAKEPASDPLHPTVQIATSLGTITVRLDAEKAPLTVDNFLTYVHDGYYDGTIVHQVLKDFPQVVLAGGYTADLSEKQARPPIRNEAQNGLKNVRGTIAMAREANAIDSATCHFFINASDNDVLDYKEQTLEGYGYCVFGQVIEGMEIVDQIAAQEVHDTDEFERIPVETVMINSIRQSR